MRTVDCGVSRTQMWPGMSIVGVGIQKPYGANYDPPEIVTVLSKRDDLNSDFGRGTYAKVRGGIPFHLWIDDRDDTGTDLTVTMSFAQDDNLTTSGSRRKPSRWQPR